MGGHNKDGCQHTTTQTMHDQPVVIQNRHGDEQLVGRTSKVVERKCGCQRYDGEIPPDMVGREFLHMGD